jgi:hypothetical protein
MEDAENLLRKEILNPTIDDSNKTIIAILSEEAKDEKNEDVGYAFLYAATLKRLRTKSKISERNCRESLGNKSRDIPTCKMQEKANKNILQILNLTTSCKTKKPFPAQSLLSRNSSSRRRVRSSRRSKMNSAPKTKRHTRNSSKKGNMSATARMFVISMTR